MVGTFFVISAPSGAGKTSIITALLKRLQPIYPINRVITYTSRKPSSTEVNGKDYHFISEDEFKAKIKDGFFLEWSEAYGAYYGSPYHILSEVNTGKSYVAVLDRNGAESVLRVFPQAICIWIYTKNMATLQSRLLKRGRENKVAINRRLMQAKKELELEKKKPLFLYHILNENFETALNKLEYIVHQSLKNDVILNNKKKTIKKIFETKQ